MRVLTWPHVKTSCTVSPIINPAVVEPTHTVAAGHEGIVHIETFPLPVQPSWSLGDFSGRFDDVRWEPERRPVWAPALQAPLSIISDTRRRRHANTRAAPATQKKRSAHPSSDASPNPRYQVLRSQHPPSSEEQA